MTAIDTPDFDAALDQDSSGAFRAAVETFLSESLHELSLQMQAGLSPADFERARRVEIALQAAGDVVRFPVNSQP